MKRNTLKTGIILGMITFLFTITTNAQSSDKNQQKKPPTFSELLKEMDKNEDGKLSKDEIKGPLKEDFAKVDLDEDGFITEAEFKKAPKPERKERD